MIDNKISEELFAAAEVASYLTQVGTCALLALHAYCYLAYFLCGIVSLGGSGEQTRSHSRLICIYFVLRARTLHLGSRTLRPRKAQHIAKSSNFCYHNVPLIQSDRR